MQRRLDEQQQQQQRPPNPNESYPGILQPSQRFGESANNMPSGIQYSMQAYQVNQNNHHSSPMHHGHHGVQAAGHLSGVPSGQQQAHNNTPSQGQQQQQQQFQRLKVEDALSYLDQVKAQFGNQPQVYNDFLDIMKEFKSQTIDTPGVINRVSNLFKGHPELIVGFNTFLPPGYKIEVQANEINVTQPNQQVVSITNSALPTSTPGPGYTKNLSNVPGASPNGCTTNQHSQNQPSRVNTEIPTPNQHSNSQGQPASQPVEFNHAINYVNKIKNRFQGQPEVYKAFLEILHTYQKEQRNLKEGINQPGYKPLTEAEVYSQVARLFQNQEDLLTEFGQFLPDANGSTYMNCSSSPQQSDSPLSVRNDRTANVKKPGINNKTQNNKSSCQLRRPSASQPPPTKKLKPSSLKDVSLAEAGKHGTLNEFAFFDKVRKMLKNSDVYENFLRCLILFNQEVLSRSELVHMVQTFLGRYPELNKWFKDFLGYKESGGNVDSVPHTATGKERISGDLAMEIDFSTCKKFGASYRALPSSYPQPKCSGRTALCKEVLNDTWVSFPSWSEDSTFVTSRKTQYEEHVYRCEDERFELDVVIETNSAVIKVLETVQKKLSRMSPEESAKFKLDNCLGGTSEVLHRKAIHRLYGDKAGDIIDGLKKNPIVAVPLVLRRLKAKEEEWRENQKQFNKLWRDQNEKFYLKSLDHMGINFKQNDVKAIRSKALLNEIETIYDEQADQSERKDGYTPGPHLSFVYKDRSTIEDATNLIVHHMKRQASISKDDKQRIKQLLHHFIPDLFFMSRGELSDDEQDKDEDMDAEEGEKTEKDNCGSHSLSSSTSNLSSNNHNVDQISDKEKKCAEMSTEKPLLNGELGKVNPDVEDQDLYSLFFVNNNWYLFFRLHQLLCDRLCQIYTQAVKIAEEEANAKKKGRKESTAIALRLRAQSDLDPDDYYPYFLEMVKNLLDGNLESSQYEDQLREMFGIHAYIAFTMDKLVQNLVRQIETLAHFTSDDTCARIYKLYHEEAKNGAVGGRVATAHQRAHAENLYQKQVENLLCDENCFKIMIYKRDCRLTIELLDTEQHEQSDDGAEDPNNTTKWANYIESYTAESALPMDVQESLTKKAVFLPRNLRHRNLLKDSPGKDCDRDSAAAYGKRLHNDIDIIDNTECKFNVNSFKMVYVVNSESYLYKKLSLKHARESHKRVSLRLHKKFDKWLSDWRKMNVSNEQEVACVQWMLGKTDGIRPSKTIIERIFPDCAPYYRYSKYKVEFYDQTQRSSNVD